LASKKRVHAIALFSGGLDSSLAILLMLKQGIEVTALMFANHFGCDIDDRGGCGRNPHPTAAKFGFRVKMVHLGESFMEIVQNPKYGYGKNMNPCIDCRILMLREAEEYMKMVGADFIITGEVLGQRPKSQMRNTLNQIIKETGLQGYLLRPLSAKLLPPTIAEEQGLVDREQLESIAGRSRKRQLELAAEFGLEDYSSPTAGCLLTDRGYSIKLRDLLEHQGGLTLTDLNLLRIGRHFRISPSAKIIIGRNQEDNEKLEKYVDNYPLVEVIGHGSPLALLIGDYDDEILKIAAALTARYSDGKRLTQVQVSVLVDGVRSELSVTPLQPQEVEPYRMTWKPRPEAPRL
jgi:tRNA U34 2-thiouridine synthase MnmA/TrmU